MSRNPGALRRELMRHMNDNYYLVCQIRDADSHRCLYRDIDSQDNIAVVAVVIAYVP